jgi:hypothetical protein
MLLLFLATAIASLAWPFVLSVGSSFLRHKDVAVAKGSMQIRFPWMVRHTNDMLLVNRFNTLHGPVSPTLSVAYIYGSPSLPPNKTKDDPSNFDWATVMEEKYRTSGYTDVRHRMVMEGAAKLYCLQGQLPNVQSDFCEDSTGAIRAVFTGSASSADQLLAMLGTYHEADGK